MSQVLRTLVCGTLMISLVFGLAQLVHARANKETSSNTSISKDNTKTALSLLLDKANSGDLWARYFLARAYFFGVNKDRRFLLAEQFEGKAFPEDTRLYWAAYQRVLQDATFEGSYQEAAKLSEEGIEKRFPPLIHMIAIMKHNGWGLDKNESEGLRWLRQAAEANYAISLYVLGSYHVEGKGIEKDPRKAVEWWQRAARLGHAGAMFELGQAHELGIGVRKNASEAYRWYRQAADLTHAFAMTRIGEIYWEGLGVEKDEVPPWTGLGRRQISKIPSQ